MSCDEVGNSGIVIQPTGPADVEALLTLENAVFETRCLICVNAGTMQKVAEVYSTAFHCRTSLKQE